MSSADLETCEICAGQGFIVSPAGLRPCKCKVERNVRFHLPMRYHNARLQSFNTRTQALANQLLDHKLDGLLLTGNPGTGKTYLAAAILREAIQRGRGAIFLRASELYSRVRESFRPEGPSERAILLPYLGVELLVFDDIGAGSLSEFERCRMLEILDVRGNGMLPTIVTTNWPLDQIGTRMDDRIESRLRAFALIQFDGDDRRGDCR